MPIQALPPSVSRTLASSQVISTPRSVVKELIDNSLDAQATAISVEISTNSLDVIQVRDDGHGVSVEDRPLLCRRHCTSKIRDLADLKFIGPKSLGFRGDALASTAELASALTITTRVEGEQIATKLSVGRNGEITGQCNASHPTGTTVRVQDFLYPLPVRRQAIIKHPARHVHAIRKLMRAYAFARPSVRLSLRVLRASNEKDNWTYAPKTDVSNKDAAFKIVGHDCAASCQWATHESHGYKLHAFLPRPEALPATISGHGCFISIDARPVSTLRGLLKQVASSFKENLRASNLAIAGVKDPFLWLSITCPSGSYDANIEPAKDDILFAEGELLLSAFEELLETVYHIPQCTLIPSSPTTSTNMAFLQPRYDELFESETPRIQQRLSQRDMPQNAIDSGSSAPPVPEYDIEDENLHNAGLSNPWILAKMTASTRSPRNQSLDREICRLPLSPLQEQSESLTNTVAGTRENGRELCPFPTPDFSSLAKDFLHDKHSRHGLIQSGRKLSLFDDGVPVRDIRARWIDEMQRSRIPDSQSLASGAIDRPNIPLPRPPLSLSAFGTDTSPGGYPQSLASMPRHGRITLAHPNKAFKIPSKVVRNFADTDPRPRHSRSTASHDQDISHMFGSSSTKRLDHLVRSPYSISGVEDDPCNRPIRPNVSVMDAGLFADDYDFPGNDSAFGGQDLRRHPERPKEGLRYASMEENDTSTLTGRQESMHDMPLTPSSQHVSHIFNIISTSTSSLRALAMQHLDLNVPIAHVGVDMWDFSSTISSLQELPFSDAEMAGWSDGLGRLLQLRSMNHSNVQEQEQLRRQIMTSLCSLQEAI